MYEDVDWRKRGRSVPPRRCSIFRIRARKTALLATMDSELSARALTLMSALAVISVLDFAQGNEFECVEKPTEQKFDNAWWALLYSEHYGSNSPQVE